MSALNTTLIPDPSILGMSSVSAVLHADSVSTPSMVIESVVLLGVRVVAPDCAMTFWEARIAAAMNPNTTSKLVSFLDFKSSNLA